MALIWPALRGKVHMSVRKYLLLGRLIMFKSFTTTHTKALCKLIHFFFCSVELINMMEIKMLVRDRFWKR